MVVAEAVWVWWSILSMIGLSVVGCCCQQQQQQQHIFEAEDNEELKRVCPECGMENPREADHCGDCGFTFNSGDSQQNE